VCVHDSSATGNNGSLDLLDAGNTTLNASNIGDAATANLIVETLTVGTLADEPSAEAELQVLATIA